MKPTQTENRNNIAQWTLLYKTGAFAAWFTVLLIPIAIASHIAWPPPPWSPGAAAEWFAYLQDNTLAGLLNLDFAMEIGLVVSIPLYLSLYIALKQHNRSLMVIATSIAVLGIFLHILSNTAWEMLLLSEAHSTATTEMEQNIFLAAGEARLSSYYGMVFQVSYILGYMAYILIGAVMRQSKIFNRTTANLAIITGIAGFGFYLPKIGTLFSVLVVILVGIWNLLVGRRLFQMTKLNNA